MERGGGGRGELPLGGIQQGLLFLVIQENRDEITALRIIYDQRYKDRPMAIAKLKALYDQRG
mgnify:CR=1 FL=1